MQTTGAGGWAVLLQVDGVGGMVPPPEGGVGVGVGVGVVEPPELADPDPDPDPDPEPEPLPPPPVFPPEPPPLHQLVMLQSQKPAQEHIPLMVA